MQVRACFLERPSIIGEDFDADGYAHRLSGHVGQGTSLFLGSEILARHNISIIYYPVKMTETIASATKGRVHDCLQVIQQDKADITRQPFTIPVMAENVTNGLVLSEYETSFVTAYRQNLHSEAPDLLEFARGFSKDYLMLFAATILAITTITLISYRVRHSACWIPSCRIHTLRLWDITWCMIACILGNFSYTCLTRMKILLILLLTSVAAYRIHVTLITRTEQVVTTKPLIMDSVQKLLDHKLHFAWSSVAEIRLFESSSDPIIRRVVQNSIRQGLESVVFSSITVREQSRRLINRLIQNEHAVVVPHTLPHDQIVCLLALVNNIDMSGYKLHRVKLDTLPKPIVGMIMSEAFVKRNASVATLIMRAIRITVLESKVANSFSVEKSRSQASFMTESIDECCLKVGRTELNPVLFTPTFKNLIYLLVTCAAAIAAATAVLVVELQTRRSKMRKIGALVTAWK